MFMGLGDVIFPGMLVLSAVQYLGGTEGILVGLTTLLGGLAGYALLMRAVSTGRAQAGLPLLNGGSILGYLIGGLLFVVALLAALAMVKMARFAGKDVNEDKAGGIKFEDAAKSKRVKKQASSDSGEGGAGHGGEDDI